MVAWRDAAQNCLNHLQAHILSLSASSATESQHEGNNNGVLRTVLPRSPIGPLNLFSETTGLNYATLISERALNETHEARASITWRFKHSERKMDDSHTKTDSDISPVAEVQRLKSAIVNEIVRTRSEIEAAKKRSGTGVERAARWKGAGKNVTIASEPTSELALGSVPAKGSRISFEAV